MNPCEDVKYEKECRPGTDERDRKAIWIRLYVNQKTNKLKIGSAENEDTQVTPLISQEQLKRVSNYVKSGIQSGVRKSKDKR